MKKTVIPIAAAPTLAATSTVVTASGLQTPPPLSLYIHWPWCVKKCPYCDFNSHESRGEIPEAEYIAAVIADLESALPQIWGRRVGTLFIGGGTPSLMSGAGMDALLTGIRTRITLLSEAEITMEANPGTVEVAKFAAFRDAGVNRVSLGIQSFDETKLKALGRIHDGNEARRAIDIALRQFDNVNIDLMYALPQQTLAEAEADMRTAIAFGTPHLSAYHLTLEPNTAFFHAPPPVPDEDLSADMQEMVEAELGAAGYQHYETSAFARPGMRARHNLNYWTFGDYLGIGAGAHGKISDHAAIVREMRHKHPRAYLDAAARGEFIQERRVVNAADLPGEFMMNALRLIDGFPSALFSERTGLPLSRLQSELLAAQREDLLEVTTEHMRPTLRGQRYLNRLLQIFLSE
ncbi:MAG: oxygen-independent coproporphyrinogen III oxidase-like protein [Rhodocyclaceae bacterium]|nr:oxygen-independent coproporphyrinogen III oxidase-like protein [Rhodocyclaceae bacterium]